MTHKERIAYAKEHKNCFACWSYSKPYTNLSGLCDRGGLDPKHSDLATSARALRARITVCWNNTCESFKEYEA